ncbi:hypothetical protein GUY44_06025 [Pimelobacter simplex]|uniref:Uncharacterized protein n=1 Tax=Nocardioides simplex TaxID=2045 RepID=A0A0C5XH45_NOCSI|nr:hypothetical protein [Pimelobacter simplex]AJR18441.1 hypothetical protein KR76_14140 [Pimelobacter simplex]MCG8150030.1 hypothetical protein [Pimelobacter simplex]GEB13761.1 hypothetical protein NSI01_20760 [Pimelobacter simplex]
MLSSVEGRQVLWSSLWPARPDDRIELTVIPDPPGPATVGHLRRRLNELLYADLRYSYGQ